MTEKLPPGIVEMVAPGIGRKEDGGLVYYDPYGNAIMESFPDGANWMEEAEEIEMDRQKAHEEFDEEFPQLKPDGSIEGPMTITSGVIPNFRMSPERLKEFLDELTDEERAILFTYYCRECGTKDVPCYCWDDT